MSKKRQKQMKLITFDSYNYKANQKYNIIIHNQIKNRNIIIIKNIIILHFFLQSLMGNDLSMIKFNYSVIKLKIKGSGPKNIFCNDSYEFLEMYYPNEVYINDVKQNKVNHN